MLVMTQGPTSRSIAAPVMIAVAPMLPCERTRSARTLPSLSRASSARLSRSRPWTALSISSVRSATHFTGRLKRPGRVRDHRVLGIDPGLHPEPTADVGDDDTDILGLAADDARGDPVADGRRHLRRGPHRQATVLLVGIGEDGARFDRRGRDPLVDDVDGDHVRGPREGVGGSLGVAVARLGADVVGRLRDDARAAVGEGGRDRCHRRLRVEVDLDQVDGVTGRDPGLGDHGADRFSDAVDAIDGERPARRGDRIGAVGTLEHRDARHHLDPRIAQLGAGQDGEHAVGRRAALASIDRITAAGCGERRNTSAASPSAGSRR